MAENTEKGTEAKEGRKVFLSVLGTGFYQKCVYYAGDFRAEQTRFIQRASLEYYGAREWTSTDLVCIFVTSKARTDNWSVERKTKDGTVERNIRKDPVTQTDEEYFGLNDELQSLGLKAPVREIPISQEGTEDAIWETFRKIYDVLQEGDEVYLDVTHAFRYIPMLVMVLLNYAKFLKHIKVMGIVYGNWESRTKNKIDAPMVNLLPFSELQDWTAAADQYISTGSVEKLRNIYVPDLTVARGLAADEAGAGAKDKVFNGDYPRLKAIVTMLNLLDNMELFGDEQFTCVGKHVYEGKAASTVQNRLDKVRKISQDTLRLQEPFIPLIDRVGDAVGEYRRNSVRNLFLTARDCCTHRNYQQATTFLMEGTVTYICKRFDLDSEVIDDRDCVSSILKIIPQNIPLREWGIPGKNDTKRADYKKKMIEMWKSPAVRDIANRFSVVQDIRNQYMHCGLLKKVQFSPDVIVSKIEECVKEFSYENLEEAFRKQGESVFVNFTNHPSSGWSEAQLAAARAIGTISDVPFPDVPTDMDEKAFDSLIREYRNRILEVCRGRQATVHIQGEMTFTYRMVSELKSRNIRCLASVTKRNTVDLGDGKSQSVFGFAGFRDY